MNSPSDNENPKVLITFGRIVKAAKPLWKAMEPDPYTFTAKGYIDAWKEQSFLFAMSYDPLKNSIRLIGKLAEEINDPSRLGEDLFWRMNATYRRAKVNYDHKLGTLCVEANGDMHEYHDVRDQVSRVFRDLQSMLNDDLLLAALKLSRARLAGVSLKSWNRT